MESRRYEQSSVRTVTGMNSRRYEQVGVVCRGFKRRSIKRRTTVKTICNNQRTVLANHKITSLYVREETSLRIHNSKSCVFTLINKINISTQVTCTTSNEV